MNAAGASPASARSKRAMYDRSTPLAREALELAAQRGQPRRRGHRGAKNSRGMRVERQHGGRQREVVGGLDQPREHRLMPAMHAVEIADRQRDRAVRRGRQPAKNPHWLPSSLTKTLSLADLGFSGSSSAPVRVTGRDRRRQLPRRRATSSRIERGRKAADGRAQAHGPRVQRADEASVALHLRCGSGHARRRGTSRSAPSWPPVLKSTIQRTPSATKLRSSTTWTTASPSTPASAHSLRASSCVAAKSQRPRARRRGPAPRLHVRDRAGERISAHASERARRRSTPRRAPTRASSHAATVRGDRGEHAVGDRSTCRATSRAQSKGSAVSPSGAGIATASGGGAAAAASRAAAASSGARAASPHSSAASRRRRLRARHRPHPRQRRARRRRPRGDAGGLVHRNREVRRSGAAGASPACTRRTSAARARRPPRAPSDFRYAATGSPPPRAPTAPTSSPRGRRASAAIRSARRARRGRRRRR